MILGILGGIGAGKSTVAKMLEDEGCQILDADRIGHEVLELDEIKSAIRDKFGESILNQFTGAIDRAKLGEMAFKDPKNLQWLNQLTHPLILKEIREQIAFHRRKSPRRKDQDPDLQGPAEAIQPGENESKKLRQSRLDVLVLDVSLLAASPLREDCDVLLFIEADEPARIQRCRARGWPPDELQKRERFQPSIDEKRRLAHRFIDNSGDLDQTRAQIRSLLKDFHVHE
jgi:dephospho-CoA kinase